MGRCFNTCPFKTGMAGHTSMEITLRTSDARY